MPLDVVVRVVQIFSYLAGAVAAVGALLVYRANARRERARWVESLYSRFFEKDELKAVRDELDCVKDAPQASALVTNESAKFTDYLNFFELVAYLQSSKQVSEADVEALFGYYLDCLRRHRAVLDYIRREDTGFEYLRRLLHG